MGASRAPEPETESPAKRPDTAIQRELGLTQRAPAERRCRERRGPTPAKDRRAPTQEGESGGARHKERRSSTQRAPAPDTEGGPRHRERRGLMQRARKSGSQRREREGPTQRAAGERWDPTQIDLEA